MNTKRKRPSYSWDRLNGTRLEVFELPGGDVRRVSINATDPIESVVAFGVHALTAHHDGRPTLRVVALDNWNADPRELFEIPAARELAAGGLTDYVVLVLSLDDPAGMRMGVAVATGGGVHDIAAQAHANRGKGLHPGVLCPVRRSVAAVALDALAPGAAQRVAAGPPPGGGLWVVCVAFGGTMLTVWNPEQ